MAIQARVDELNNKHYELLSQRDALTEQILANGAELAQALDELAEAEREQALANRPDLSGAVAPADPPPTRLGQALDASGTGE